MSAPFDPKTVVYRPLSRDAVSEGLKNLDLTKARRTADLFVGDLQIEGSDLLNDAVLRSDASIAGARAEWKKLGEQKAQSKSNSTLGALLMAATRKKVPDKDALDQATEIAELRAVLELIDTKKQEIASGRRFVQNAQNSVMANAKKVTRKTDLALALLKTCSAAQEHERMVMAKLDDLKRAAKQRMKQGILRFFNDLDQASFADGIETTASIKIERTHLAKVCQIFHEPARKRTLELIKRNGGQAPTSVAPTTQTDPANLGALYPQKANPSPLAEIQHQIQQNLGRQH